MLSGKYPNWPKMIKKPLNYTESATKKVLGLILSINLIVNLNVARLIN